MTKQSQPAPTFSLETLRAIIATPEAKALFAEMMQGKPTSQDRSSDMDKATKAAFKRKGFTDIRPRENILTFNRWVERGYKVRSGESSIRVKSLRLFHESQVEPLSKQEQAKLMAERAAKVAKRTSDKLPVPSPVTPAPAKAAKAKPASKATVVPIRDQQPSA